MDSGAKTLLSLVGFIVFIGVVLLINPFVQVGTGERVVVTHFGAVKGELGPGIHFLAPITESAITFNVQTQKEQAKASAASSDLQTVNTDIAVNYNVDPNKVSDLYTKVGVNYQATIIDPAIQEVVKSVTANYTAEELITKRAQVTSDIQNALAAKLQPSDITVTTANVVDFNFSDQFNQAIEAKVTAEQNALAAKNKLEQVQYEAQQTVTSAKAQAEAIQIQAQAINSQGGADYVNLQAVKQWDGHLPTQMVPGSALPFLNLTK